MSIVTACVLFLAMQTQPSGAQVSGTVRDASTNEPVPAALVVLGDADRSAVTDADGRFSFHGVPAGPQHLSVSRIGFAARTLHALVPGTGLLQIDVALRPEPVPMPALNVMHTRSLPGVERADSTAFPDGRISLAGLRNHPALAEPDAFRALAGGAVVLDPEAPAGLHVRGGATDHTAYLLDGIPVLSPYHSAGLFSAWNPDAIAEVHLAAAAPSPALPDALSGTIVATTRQPGTRLRLQSALSNTQARLTIDGPTVVADARYLVSWRSNLPAAIGVKDEPSYLRAETGDLLARVELDAFDGAVGVLVYDSENEIEPGRLPRPNGGPVMPDNAFAWHSRSMGGRFRRVSDRTTYELRAWHAQLDASATWVAAEIVSRLRASHDDAGIAAGIELSSRTGVTHAGVRFSELRSDYRVQSTDSSGAIIAIAPSTRIARAYVEHSTVPGAVNARAGTSLTLAEGRVHFSPRAELRARIAHDLALTLAYSRTHQFAQSLRNPETIVRQIFPVDVVVAAGDGGAAVAGSEQVAAAGTWRPAGAVRLGIQAYARRMDRIVNVATGSVEPFGTDPFNTSGGSAHGASIELAAGGARYGLIMSYGWQQVRLEQGDSAFVPWHGTVHLFDTGLILYPTATSSVRLALSGGAGRTGTAVSGPFEYEACNILDTGCEFAGSPRLEGAIGGERLPPYLRIDAGARKHWHVRTRSRDHLVGVFGTLTNILGRRNVLTYAVDESDHRDVVEMLPRSPLVIGVDWRF